jgi:hypothetical protein
VPLHLLAQSVHFAPAEGHQAIPTLHVCKGCQRAAGGHQDCTALLATLRIDPLNVAGTEITRVRLPRTPPTADWMRELLGMRTLGQFKQRGCT